MSTIQCIGFVMDGNRRWAKQKGLPSIEGHTKGFEKFKEVLGWLKDTDVETAIFYAFSTENWKRARTEVNYLLKLFEQAFASLETVHRDKIRIRFIGQIDRFPRRLQKLIRKIERETKEYTSKTVAVALSYGGRADILQAVNKLVKKKRTEITEDELKSELWTEELPDPDLIVRTGKETRLSNFLTWQSAYSELHFTPTMWPDFDKKEFNRILASYDKRERRYGT